MKKIILTVLTVLLSFGLITAQDTETRSISIAAVKKNGNPLRKPVFLANINNDINYHLIPTDKEFILTEIQPGDTINIIGEDSYVSIPADGINEITVHVSGLFKMKSYSTDQDKKVAINKHNKRPHYKNDKIAGVIQLRKNPGYHHFVMLNGDGPVALIDYIYEVKLAPADKIRTPHEIILVIHGDKSGVTIPTVLNSAGSYSQTDNPFPFRKVIDR